MKIYKYNIPNELIFKYCKIIKLLEIKYDAQLERDRSEIHNQIFDIAKCDRSLYRRDDRRFNTALNKTIIELVF